MKNLILGVFGMVTLLMSCNLQNTNKKGSEFTVEFEKYKLSNGLEVVLHEDKSDPIVSVAILFHVGSNRERPGKTGYAHFFEHMLFQNSENVGKGQFFTKINNLGGTFNGGTWRDGTIYFETVPNDALEVILWMESDRMGFMRNTITLAALEREKDILINEKRERVDNKPYGFLNEIIAKNMFPQDHPYSWTTIGSSKDLREATLDDMFEFYDNYYGPNNATLVIAGDFDKNQTKQWVEKYFAEINAKQEVKPLKKSPAKLDETKMLVHEDNFAQLPQITITYPSCEEYHEDSYALTLLGKILSQGKKSPLYKVIVEDKKIAAQASSWNSADELAGLFYFRVNAFNNIDLDDAYAAIQEAFVMFETEGFSDSDLQRLKNLTETGYFNEISSTIGKAEKMAGYNVFASNPGFATDYLKKLNAVTKEDIVGVYEKYIKGKNHLVLSIVPKGHQNLAVENSLKADIVEDKIDNQVMGDANSKIDKDEPFERTPSKIDRSIEPQLGATPLVKNPKIWTDKLSNGMAVYGIEHNELPVVQFSIRIMGGHYLDDLSKPGTANILGRLLKEGTKTKTPQEVQDIIGNLGASIYVNTNLEYITLYGNCLSKNYEALISLVEEMIINPRWDENEFIRIKEGVINEIQQASASPSSIGQSAITGMMFCKSHILSTPVNGTVKSVNEITLDDVKGLYDKYFSPSLASFHIAGNLSKVNTLKSLASISKSWVAKEVSLPEYECSSSSEGSRLYFIDQPGARQSYIILGKTSLLRNDKNYYHTQIANYKLGSNSGGFLFNVLRLQKQYTYGAYSQFEGGSTYGTFYAYSNVQATATLDAVNTFKDIISTYNEKFTEDLLGETKRALIRNNTMAFETLWSLLGVLQSISTYNLPANYVQEEQEILQSVSLDEIKGVISKTLDQGDFIYIVVGDKKTQFEALKDVGLGNPILIENPLKL
jgi:zinc protease